MSALVSLAASKTEAAGTDEAPAPRDPWGRTRWVLNGLGLRCLVGPRYTWVAYDVCGEYASMPCRSFEEAISRQEEFAVKHGGRARHVELQNLDRIDIGCEDGLTRQEREIVLDGPPDVDPEDVWRVNGDPMDVAKSWADDDRDFGGDHE